MSKFPNTITFTSQIDIQAAKDEKSSPTFSMLAYTGGPMMVAGFDLPVVVDLTGLQITRQQLPVRLEHDPTKGVGHTSSVIIDNCQLKAEGVISRDTGWARDVANSGKRGFPWQVSIGAAVLKHEYLQPDAIEIVNGQEITGDCYIVRSSILKELSFVDSGADTATEAQITANNHHSIGGTHSMPETKTDETKDIKACDCADCTTCQTCKSQEKPIETIEAKATPSQIEAAAVADPVADMRIKAAAESKRIADIRSICKGEHADIEAKAIEKGWNTTQCELEVLRASRPSAPAIHIPTTTHSPQIFEAVALMSSGLSTPRLEAMYDSPTLEAADKLRGIGIQEFCEQVVGNQLPRFRRDASGWLQAAFSTTSLPGILSNIANKMLLEGYNYIEDAWRQICKIASVNDFKEHTRYRMTGAFKFEQVGADGELKHGKLDELKFGQKADTHGIMFALTRQMIINDDMGAFTDIPRQIGMGAAEAIADAVWGLLLSNPNSFFSAGNKNYSEGAETALSVDALTAAEILFGEQTKPNGRPLGISPRILLVPIALKVIAQQLMKSVDLNETTTANKAKPKSNPHVGKFDVVSSSYLGNASFDGASSKAWYLFADPNRLPALEVAFLNGVDRPTVEKTDADFNTLGIQFRGYIDFGVREQDHRGAAKFKGE